jgi:hypothetical protein
MSLRTASVRRPRHTEDVTVVARVDRRKVRPRRVWFVVAALLAAGVVAGAVVAAQFAAGGTVGQRFTVGQPVRVQLSASQPKMVWARADEPGMSNLRCAVRPLGFVQDSIDFVNVATHGRGVERDAYGHRWRGVLTVVSSPAGGYELTCTSDRPGAAAASLAVGDAPRFLDPRSRFLGGAVLVGLVGVGLSASVAVVVVVATRRSLHAAGLRHQEATSS